MCNWSRGQPVARNTFSAASNRGVMGVSSNWMPRARARMPAGAGARGILLSIAGGDDMTLYEVNEAAELVTAASDPSANVIFGAIIDESLKGDVRVTVIATGFGAGGEHRRWQATRTGERVREKTAPESFEVPEDVLEIPSFLRED